MPLGPEHYQYDDDGFLPIHEAIIYGDIDRVRKMIEEDPTLWAAPTLGTNDSPTPLLHFMIYAGIQDSEIPLNDLLSLALKTGADFSQISEMGKSTLHVLTLNWLSLKLRDAVFEEIIKAHAKHNLIDHADLAGETALHIAKRQCKTNLADMLIDAGANPKLLDADGNSPDSYIKNDPSSLPRHRLCLYSRYSHSLNGDLTPLHVMHALMGKQLQRYDNGRHAFSPYLFSHHTYPAFVEAAAKHAPKPFIINAIVNVERHRTNFLTVLDKNDKAYILCINTSPPVKIIEQMKNALSDTFDSIDIITNKEKIQYAGAGCNVFSQYFAEKLSRLTAIQAIPLIKFLHELYGSHVPITAFPSWIGMITTLQSFKTLDKLASDYPHLRTHPYNKRGDTVMGRIQKGTNTPYRQYKHHPNPEKRVNGVLVQKQHKQGTYAKRALDLADVDKHQRMLQILGLTQLREWGYNIPQQANRLEHLENILEEWSKLDFMTINEKQPHTRRRNL